DTVFNRMDRGEQLYHGSHVPFLRIFADHLAGICLAGWVPPSQGMYQALCAAALCCTMCFLGLWAVFGFFKRRMYPIYGLLFFSFLLITGWSMAWEDIPQVDKAHFSRSSADVLLGYVADEPKIMEGSQRFLLKIKALSDA